MSTPTAKLKRSIAKLGDLLRRETEALQSTSLSALPKLITQKHELLGGIEELSLSLSEGERLSADLHSEVEQLRSLALTNAEKLQSIAEGAARAQKRLQGLKEKELTAGAYTASGGERKFQSSGELGAKV